MSTENQISQLYDTVEEKRRKNIIDNQHFLESLNLLYVREDLKSAVNSATIKPSRKNINRKKNIDPSDLRRSSRLQSMPRVAYNNQSINDDDDKEDLTLSSDATSNEEADDLGTAFMNKMDGDWQPSHQVKIVPEQNTRSLRKINKTNDGSVRTFSPNVGLEASKVMSKTKSYKSYVSKKINVAISSSSEEEEDENE